MLDFRLSLKVQTTSIDGKKYINLQNCVKFSVTCTKNPAKYLKPKRINLTDKAKCWHFKHNPIFFTCRSKYLDLGKTCHLHLMPYWVGTVHVNNYFKVKSSPERELIYWYHCRDYKNQNSMPVFCNDTSDSQCICNMRGHTDI